MEYRKVLDFWFREAGPEKWFAKDDAFDADIRRRFLDTYHAAMRGETSHWRETPRGRLAEIILLDQFPRNMFRGTADAFSGDKRAFALAQEAIELSADTQLAKAERRFLYMPYMHSESKAVHKKAIWLFLRLLDLSTFRYELKHKRVIDRFGRYPHRNTALGRESTPEEVEWMKKNNGF